MAKAISLEPLDALVFSDHDKAGLRVRRKKFIYLSKTEPSTLSKNVQRMDHTCRYDEAGVRVSSKDLSIENTSTTYKNVQKINEAEFRVRTNTHKLDKQTIEKFLLVENALMNGNIKELREYARSRGGFYNNEMRVKVWPMLVGVQMSAIKPYEGPPFSDHKDRAQVQLDIEGCIKNIPKDYSEFKKREFINKLLRVILRLLSENQEMHYYLGFYKIVLIFLLVGGEDFAYAIMSVLVKHHIRNFMDKTIERTKMIISLLPSLLRLECPELESFITKSRCEYNFCLSWLITWFGHVVHSPDEGFRLVDLFLASHPLMPIYMAGAMVLKRQPDVLALDCEMSDVYGFLSQIPNDIDYECIIEMTCMLFKKHPPDSLISSFEGEKVTPPEPCAGVLWNTIFCNLALYSYIV